MLNIKFFLDLGHFHHQIDIKSPAGGNSIHGEPSIKISNIEHTKASFMDPKLEELYEKANFGRR